MSKRNLKFPPWYSEEHYFQIQEFNLYDIFYNLQLRFLLSQSVISNNKFSSGIKQINKQNIIDCCPKEMIDHWINYNLERVPTDIAIEYSNQNLFHGTKNTKDYKTSDNSNYLYKKSIYPVSWNDLNIYKSKLNIIKNELPDKEKKLYSEQVKNKNYNIGYDAQNLKIQKSPKQKTSSSVFDVLHEPLCLLGERLNSFTAIYNDIEMLESHDVLINLDLRCPDTVLKKEFIVLLKELRKRKHLRYLKGKETKSANIQRWVDFKVFEYFDLVFWFAYTNQKVTDYQMGTILFPDELEVDITKKIRNTTRKYIDQLLSREYQDKLFWEHWANIDKY